MDAYQPRAKRLPLSELERSFIERVAERYPAYRDALLQQLAAAEVVERRFTGVGLYTDFSCSASVRRLSQDVKAIDGVYWSAPHIGQAGELILWFEHGIITTMEGYSFQENWPQDPDFFPTIE